MGHSQPKRPLLLVVDLAGQPDCVMGEGEGEGEAPGVDEDGVLTITVLR